MAADTLFSFVETLQGSRRWGRVLDAGTGEHSLVWLATLATESWTAVTGEASVARRLETQFTAAMRPADAIVCGNWSDPTFLHGECYDVVIADYLLGAIDGFAPYYQDRLFHRLRPHAGARLYVIGLEPYPAEAQNEWGRTILELTRLRDACILLAGHRMYREYPLDWTVRHVEEAAFVVEEARFFPIRYGPRFVEECSKVVRSKLPYLVDRRLAVELEGAIERLRERALATHDVSGSVPFGEDYVIAARPRA